ncbi:MAG TPA: methionine--tRNA ligase [Actinomycetota bacterium]|jgi:methionyl-tRNA synthetase|nr:methionine--tRNA ligase [Actinomycetota bacterium]
MKDTFYITTPIYYPSDVPHLGSAYPTIVCDFVARWHRLHGRKAYFLTGTDEHGGGVGPAAEEHQMGPQEWVDHIVPRWQELWQRLEITNDDFIRTSEQRHKDGVVPFMDALREAGDVYLGTYEGWYCDRCEEFKGDDELVDGNCPIHNRPVNRLQEENYFFKLSAYNDRLLRLYDDQPDFLQPKRAYNEMYSLLRQGLRDQPITRTSLSWGIRSPWKDGHIIYVWIEALQNYITALGFPDGELYQRCWPADVHVIGKEIVRHHAVVWPAMLMSVGLPLPKRVFAHGWLLVGGEKISKSGRGITDISPYELVDQFGLDAYRYHFVRYGSWSDDGNFSIEDMTTRYNAELANDLGNLASRTIAMIERYFGGVVPDASISEGAEDALLATISGAGSSADSLVADLRVPDAVSEIWEIVRHANRYLVEREPWKLARDEANLPLVGSVLHVAAEALANVAALLAPVMPIAMRELWGRLGYEGEPRVDPPAPAGNRVTPGDALFPRLEA